MFASDVLDPKVVDDEGESDRAGFVAPQGRCVLDGFVSVGCEVFFEAFVGDPPGLFEAGHTLAYFHVDIAVVFDGVEVVCFYNFVGYFVRNGSSCIRIAPSVFHNRSLICPRNQNVHRGWISCC